ncbi:MAG: FimB/Mfa2 family fimbrial subunit [Muribaculaceae bacterium]
MTYSNIFTKTCGATLALLVSLLFACTKEDLSDCGILITFSNINHEAEFPKDLNKINLYVFDEQGLFVESYVNEDIKSQQTASFKLQLPAGKYKMVAWGDLNEDYILPKLEKGKSNISEATLSLKRENDKVTKRLSSLYHGHIEDVVVSGNGGRVENNIELMNDANAFHITIKGLPMADGATAEEVAKQHPIHITDNNGDYKFDNSLATTKPITYIPAYSVKDKSIIIETTVLRLFEKGATTLVLEAENVARAHSRMDWNLVDLILKSDKIKDQNGLDRCDYYDIEITIDDSTNTTATIKVNGWVVFNISEEI